MSSNILDEIIENKKIEVAAAKKQLSAARLREQLGSRDSSPRFAKALARPGISLIAEIKSFSPSAGRLTSVPPVEIARVYQENSPRAVSVLTDKKFFGQDINLLRQLRQVIRKPLLRKDFIIDSYQIYQAAAAGADCILLIALILSRQQLADFYQLAGELNLDVLVEIHRPEELEKLNFTPKIIGVNNRRLQGDLSTDLTQTARLIPFLPEKSLLVSESGISSKEDVDYLESLRSVDAILVGTGLLKSTRRPGEIEKRLENLKTPS